MNSLLKKYQELPRSGKWLVWTLLVVIAYFGVVEPTLEATNASKARADMLAAGLAKERDLTSADSDQGRILADGRLNFGEPYLPEDPRNKPEALHTLVDRILNDNRVGNRTKNERHIRLSNPEVESLLGPLAATHSVERLILDITFEASPEAVTAVLSELEQSKEVAAISRVDIRRQDLGGRGAATSSKTVKATISPEAWVLIKTGAGAATGGLR